MDSMKAKTMFCGLLVWMLALPLHAGSGGSDFLHGYFAALKTFSADFEQQVIGEQGERLQTARGHMWISRPGKFRWDYTEPDTQMLLGDGRRVWNYDPELEQVIVKPLDSVLDATPAMLLSGNADLDKLFTIAAQGEQEGKAWFTLVPRDRDDVVSHVRMVFAGSELSGLEFTDRMGQITQVRFTGVNRNHSLDAGLFDFSPPPGVDVLGDL